MDTPETPPAARRFASFAEFYPFYLGEYADRRCRRLHFAGSAFGLARLALLLATGRPVWLLGGYACAWTGHLVFEKNRPATFRYPIYSFAADWVMFRDMLTGRIRF